MCPPSPRTTSDTASKYFELTTSNSNSSAPSSDNDSTSSCSPTSSLSLTRVYLIIWCLHLIQPWADLTLFGRGHGGLDSRPWVEADSNLLLPALVTTLISLLLLLPVVGDVRNGTSTGVVVCSVMAVGCHLLDLGIRLQRLPAVWDHELWGLLINLSFILCFGFAILKLLTTTATRTTTLPLAEESFLRLARWQMAIFYAAATFWKVNTSFMEPSTSCGTILVLELLACYYPPLSSWSGTVVTLLIQLAPTLTLLMEGALAVGMLYAACALKSSVGGDDGRKHDTTVRSCRDATVLLANAFHLLIFLMYVNSAGGFSLECLSRLVLFFDSNEMDILLRRGCEQCLLLGVLLVVVGLGIPAILMVCRYMATGAPFDVGFAAACLLVVFHVLIVVTRRRHDNGVGGYDDTDVTSATNIDGSNAERKATAAAATTTTKTTFTNKSDAKHGPGTLVLQAVILALTLVYAFLTPILGIMQQSAPTMYANLRSYHGGNHYLVPTAILGEEILYGGLVQVVNSTSWSVNLLLAHISSRDAFPQVVVDMLEPRIRSNNNKKRSDSDIGNNGTLERLPLQLYPMCIYNPHSKEVLMDDYRKTNPSPNTPLLASFIIPISTLRQALQAANENGESFVVDFAESLDPNPSTIVQIDHKGFCQVIVKDESLHTASCNDDNDGGDCSTNRIAQKVLGPPLEQDNADTSMSWLWKPLVDKLLVPYPQIVGMPEEICMS